MSLLSNKLSRFVIAFLPRSKHLLISWLPSPSAVILEPKNLVCHYFHCFSIYLPWSDGAGCYDLQFWMLSFKPTFSPSFHPHPEALQFLFTFCHKSGVICVSEVVDISPGNLNYTCASSTPAFRMMCSAYKLNKQGDNIQPWHIAFPIWNQSVVPCPVLTVASWPAYRFLKRQVRWSGIPISQNFPQFLVIHTVKVWPNQ